MSILQAIPLSGIIPVQLAFSLLIYFWAWRLALPAERIQRMIDEVVLVETGH